MAPLAGENERRNTLSLLRLRRDKPGSGRPVLQLLIWMI